MKKIYLFIFLLMFVASVTNAQTTYTWIGANNASWATSTNWSPTRTVPATNDVMQFNDGTTKNITAVPTQTIGKLLVSASTNITLQSSGTVTLTVGNNTGDDIVIASGSSMTIGGSNGITVTLASSATADISGSLTVNSGRTFNTNGTSVVTTVTGSVVNSGTVTCTTASKLLMNGGSSYQHSQNGGTIPTATWTSSTCNVTGITSTAPGGLGQSFHHFTWDNSGQTGNVNLSGGLTTVNGNLTISNTNGNELRLTGATSFTLNIGGDLIINNSSNLVISNGDDAAVTINVTGNYSQDSGSFGFFTGTGGGNTLNATFDINVTGNFSQSGGSLDFASGSNNVAGRNTRINLGGNFSQSGSATITTSTSDVDIVNGTITFNKAGTQTYNAVPANTDFTNFIIASGSTLQLNSNVILTSNATANWGGKFTINSGGTLNAGTNQILSSATTGVNNAFTLSSGGTLRTANLNGVQNGTTATISNQLATSSFSTSAKYAFNGSGVQATTGMPSTIDNIEINNSSGVTLSGATTANSATAPLTLTNGILSGATLTIGSAYIGAGGGGSASSHVSSSLAKTGSTAYEFPVGNGTVYRPISVSSLSGSATITASYTQANPETAFGTSVGSGINHITKCEYWNLDDGVASITGMVGLKFGGSCNSNPYVDDPTTLRVAHWNGSTWEDKGNNGSATSTNVQGNIASSFSPFTIGSSGVLNPLPVKLGNIKAFEKQQGVQIDWTAYQEENLSRYAVERSANGSTFISIGEVAARNSASETSYGFFDANPLPGINFYRLRSIDMDSKSAYSSIVKVNLDKTVKDISLYPNPATGGYISFQGADLAKGNYTVKVFNSTGMQIMNQNFSHTGGAITQTLKLPAGISSGMYSLQLVNDGVKVMSKTFMVQ